MRIKKLSSLAAAALVLAMGTVTTGVSASAQDLVSVYNTTVFPRYKCSNCAGTKIDKTLHHFKNERNSLPRDRTFKECPKCEGTGGMLIGVFPKRFAPKGTGLSHKRFKLYR